MHRVAVTQTKIIQASKGQEQSQHTESVSCAPVSTVRPRLCHGIWGCLCQLFLQQQLISAAVDSPHDGETLRSYCSPQTCHCGFTRQVFVSFFFFLSSLEQLFPTTPKGNRSFWVSATSNLTPNQTAQTWHPHHTSHLMLVSARSLKFSAFSR